MKQFNFNKKLKTEKNKVSKKQLVIGTTLVLIGAIIGLSFASYTVESDEYVVINSKVGEFSLSDVEIAVLVDGAKSDSFPTEGSGYAFESVTCENGSTGTWDSTKWKLILEVSEPDECTVSFIKVPTAVEYITNLFESNTATMNNDDPDGNIRYMGADPNNYVTFNGESWRIIGVFDVAPSASGTKEERVKLIRTKSIGRYSWDSSASGVSGGWGVNEWSQADIMTTLNSGAYYNRTSGTCYNNSGNSTTSCDFSSTGLTNDAKALIGDAYWNTGTISQDWNSASSTTTTPTFYTGERSTNTGKICSSGTWCSDTVTRTTGWVGKVGLMYPSDYGYATSGGSTTNRATCLSTALYSWRESGVTDCKNNSWLSVSLNQWTLTPMPLSPTAYSIFVVYSGGGVDNDNAGSANNVHPVVYLNSSVLITGGDGTSGNPYTLT